MSDNTKVDANKTNTHKVNYATKAEETDTKQVPEKEKTNEDKTDDSKDIPTTEKTVQIHGTIKKKSTFSKIKEEFFGDSPDSVKNYVIDDVIIPSVKSLISSAVTSGINALLYGHDNARGYSNRSYGSQNVRNYNTAPWEPIGQPKRVNYSASSSGGNAYRNSLSRRQIEVDEVIFDTRDEAMNAIQRMEEYIAVYGSVSILRYYDICGVSANFAQNNYGWTSTANMHVNDYFDHDAGRQVYTIVMPPAIPL